MAHYIAIPWRTPLPFYTEKIRGRPTVPPVRRAARRTRARRALEFLLDRMAMECAMEWQCSAPWNGNPVRHGMAITSGFAKMSWQMLKHFLGFAKMYWLMPNHFGICQDVLADAESRRGVPRSLCRSPNYFGVFQDIFADPE